MMQPWALYRAAIIILANIKPGIIFTWMITRGIVGQLQTALEAFPVVGLVGPRQAGKTTLAKMIGEERSPQAVYLDLERPSDVAKLADAELYLSRHVNTLVVLDEIQCRPDLFPLLRSLVDQDRRNGRFLVLGSASPELRRGSSESLAGRIVYLELGPFNAREVVKSSPDLDRLWLRGGFPRSYLQPTTAAAFNWLNAFIATYLERDLPQLGIRIPAAQLRRFWEMLAHIHGQLWNGAKIAGSLGVSGPTVRHYLDILQDTFMVRQLQPWFPNTKKRLVKSPKIYFHDTGLLHALLRLSSLEALLAHPMAGLSWEGFWIEQILAALPQDWRHYFYRSAGGAEMDLVLQPEPQARPVAVEIKLSAAPAIARGFREAYAELNARQGYILHAGTDTYALAPNIIALASVHFQSLISDLRQES